MAIPSGSGTEVLKRAFKDGLNNGWHDILTGSNNHIYTILSLVFTDQQDASGNISVAIKTGSTYIYILSGHSHSAQATFTWNDKIVLHETDILQVYNTVTLGDWWLSYIDQDWT